MAIRFYLVPLETVALPGGTTRAPKYFKRRGTDPANALMGATDYDLVDYGMEPVALVRADVSNAQNTLLAAQSDVTVIPANLNSTVGTQRATVEGKLESYGIPGNWVTAAATYRQTLRALLAIFRVAKRFHEDGYTRLTPPGVTLATTYAQMPVEYRDDLVAAIDALGYDRSTLTAQSTLRDLLTTIAGQGAPEPILGE